MGNVESALRKLDALSPSLRQRLENLCGEPHEAVEEAIALWKVGDRIMLASAGIISTTSGLEDAERGEPADFSLTATGRRLVSKEPVH